MGSAKQRNFKTRASGYDHDAPITDYRSPNSWYPLGMPSSDLAVRVRTPSRLHFGLLAYGDAAPRQFGGVGMMIERPGCELVVDLAPEPGWKPSPASDAERRAWEFARKLLDNLAPADRSGFDERFRLRLIQSAPEHVGLGSGTQLAMAVARALAIWAGRPDMPPEELARRVGRGARSAIGVHGFNCGGLIVEGGKPAADQLAPLVARLSFPAEWYFVLVIPQNSKGLHGLAEREAFEGLPPIPLATTAELCRLTLLGMLPAVAERDFDGFSESLFEFGQKVGECFAACQAGIFASPLAGEIVAWFRRQGIHGLAQSSWGPTLAAVADSRFRAEWLAARLADTLSPNAAAIITTPANNVGARVEVVNRGCN
jgi:beta-RFAP synthase